MISPFWIFVNTVQRRMRERSTRGALYLKIDLFDGRTTITIDKSQMLCGYDVAAEIAIESVSYPTEPEDAERAAQTQRLGKIKIPARVAADLNAREDAIDRRLYKRPTKRKLELKHAPRLTVKARGSDRFEERVDVAWFEKAARASVKESEKK